MACPESASLQLSFVFGREHQNDSHVYFRISNVLEVANGNTVTTFVQRFFEVVETPSLVMLGILSSSNTNSLCRNSIMSFSKFFFQDCERMGKPPMAEIALKFTENKIFQRKKPVPRLVPRSF